MPNALSFKFRDKGLNRRLIGLLRLNDVPHRVTTDGTIHYSLKDEERVENDLIGSIRSLVFHSWQVLSCPASWTERYKAYMKDRHIRFEEEVSNGESCFLISGRCRPASWKLEEVALAK